MGRIWHSRRCCGMLFNGLEPYLACSDLNFSCSPSLSPSRGPTFMSCFHQIFYTKLSKAHSKTIWWHGLRDISSFPMERQALRQSLRILIDGTFLTLNQQLYLTRVIGLLLHQVFQGSDAFRKDVASTSGPAMTPRH